ncbi:protein mono-ADP-ribosyltransferase PARP10 [Notolabrus celidotus]|uniref:protein mono-ADP-ribosyltransferase PARP10 n=1 Tax=Notolabrus celidotus TaxID=1203425 RepID=UPI001490188E|nr:protein mono-ADP-ribosyltransferase PARP10 [Notolabrus celidotus]XP_034561261.1 protein mono-ADP-ribosyltransferase PARP10 [Notolabrus celidotus]XP_034561262.1 protein mono-ADP-ribosyltransferase PARP10 [Notolabrus celidotus]
MSAESPEERTVEVLALPEVVDEELLFLYFENKRRSGGGSLVSVDKKKDRAILVFEEADAAARVLTKGHHVLHNAELCVRKPATKDPCRLLLRGINPNTNAEMIDLFVENMMGLNPPDFSLHHSPGRDLLLIQLSQPFSKDFQSVSAKISKRKLDGAKLTLEQVDQTDSILVENLHPGTISDMITLHFENKGGGSEKVKEITKLSESTARVSFTSYEAVDLVLNQPHRLDGADLVVRPYFDFLQPDQSLTSQDSAAGGGGTTEGSNEDLTETPMQTSPSVDVSTNSQTPSQTAPEPLPAHMAEEENAVEVMEEQSPEEEALPSHVAVADPIKLSLFRLSTFKEDIEKAYPDFTIQIKDNGVYITGSDRQKMEQIRNTILDSFAKIAECHLILELEMAHFLAREDVREHLLHAMNQMGLSSMYTVSGCNVVVTSLSQQSANQACSFLKSQLCHFSIPMVAEYECMLYCREWTEFMQALSFSSVKVSERGNIDVLTLKDMESEKQVAIQEFLSTPIERETVIPMEPGMLKYIQNHCHQLLADMDQVSIFPLEADDACGLKIHGPAIACQMAEEVLQSVISSVLTKTITVNAPGITRFFADDECKNLMKEMERKFSVYINPLYVTWEPLAHQDVFETAWMQMSRRNFPRVSLDDSAAELKSDSMQTDGAADKGLLEEAKRLVPTVDVKLEEGVSDGLDGVEEEDLYTAEEPPAVADQDSGAMLVDTSLPTAGEKTTQLNDGAVGLSRELEEEAQLSLAIQYSMESSDWSLEDEEEQLKRALELSKTMVQHADKSPRVDKPRRQDMSIQEAIKAASTLQLFVFAGYACDLTRVDIAFGKKVSQRQVEERVEHRTVKRMSEYHKNCLEMIKRKHAVDIQVQGTIITVSGFKDFVYGGMLDVKLLLEKMPNYVSDSEILRTVQWLHENPATKDSIPYSPDAIVFIENIWRKKLTEVDILLDNQPHRIDFEKMQEYNIASGKSVKISRKRVDVGDLETEVPVEEYSLLSNLPEASKVHEESDEFQNVVKSFYETIQEYHSKIRIIQVEKLMNRLLYNQYKLKKASVLQQATYPVVERTLYHGTSETSVKEICVHGFNRSFCGKNATVYGQGVYFAVNSALSVQDQYSPPNSDGYKFIMVSKVLTGDYTKGCHSMKTAPLKETGDIPLRYDSVTDDITKPSMFVIFNDTQAFPEYLITCQRIHR